tara:strand:+ start:357 stop:497 length:141 start_codon:yes stop_codon:yes gene_type:complete
MSKCLSDSNIKEGKRGAGESESENGFLLLHRFQIETVIPQGSARVV